MMPDHAGDRGAVFLGLAPHDHHAYEADSGDARTQKDLFGAARLMIAVESSPAQIGGSARGYQEPFSPWAISAGPEQAGCQVVRFKPGFAADIAVSTTAPCQRGVT
jgi:hypothetical protein